MEILISKIIQCSKSTCINAFDKQICRYLDVDSNGNSVSNGTYNFCSLFGKLSKINGIPLRHQRCLDGERLANELQKLEKRLSNG